MHIGTLSSIWRYPVKSLGGERLETVEISSDGLDGDRTDALIIRNGPQRAGKPYRGKEDETLHLHRDVERATAEAAARGYGVEIESDERYFDDSPVSLIVDRWLDGLSRHAGYAIEPERFRPNFIVTASADFNAFEPDLTGRMIGIGDVRLRVRYPIERCVVPNYGLSGEAADPRILRYLAQARNAWMGIYCDVLRAGTVRASASVDVVEA